MATKLGRFHSLKAPNDDSGGETCTSFFSQKQASRQVEYPYDVERNHVPDCFLISIVFLF